MADSKTSRFRIACLTIAGGLALERVDGGPIEDITISNVTMRDIVNSPIFLRLGSRLRAPEGTPMGDIRRVNIANFVVYNADPRYSSIISSIPGHDIEDVNLSNIRIVYKGGGTKEQAAVKVPENETMYPEPRMFGVTPAYGFFIRHVKRIALNNVDVRYQQEDQRPRFLLEHVTEAEINHVKAEHAAGVPVVRLEDVNGFSTHNSPWAADVKLGRVDEKQF